MAIMVGWGIEGKGNEATDLPFGRVRCDALWLCALAAAAAEPPVDSAVCASKESCDVIWSAALEWVQNNCGLRIQNMTDMFIQTYKSSDDADTSTDCEVSKFSRGGGNYEIKPNS
jgi:hypothetical protein